MGIISFMPLDLWDFSILDRSFATGDLTLVVLYLCDLGEIELGSGAAAIYLTAAWQRSLEKGQDVWRWMMSTKCICTNIIDMWVF